MKKYKVSIIVPVYGVEKYIDQCLDSLVNQTLEDVEIIVVNDGSKDQSQRIVDKYQQLFPNKIKSFIKENGGQGSARNFGLQKATGDYIGYVDSDDFVDKMMFEKLYEKAQHSHADIVICGSYHMSEDGVIQAIDIKANQNMSTIERAMLGKLAVWNKLYQRELLVQNSLLFKENVWYEDLAFSLKAIMSAKKIDFIEEPLYYYLIRQGSTMNNSNIRKNLEILDAFNDIITYVQKNQIQGYDELLEYLVIDHVYISGIVRVLRANASKKGKTRSDFNDLRLIDLHYPNFKKNHYIQHLPRNRKIIFNLLNQKDVSSRKFDIQNKERCVEDDRKK